MYIGGPIRRNKAFFFFNPNPTSTNFTFIGQVVPAPTSTNCLSLPPGWDMIGSPLPASVNEITNAPVSLPLLDGMIILEWDGSKYVETMFDRSAGGWVQADDVTPSVAPPYRIGQGFFLFEPSLAAIMWCQGLP
jgi:hypothetical protein